MNFLKNILSPFMEFKKADEQDSPGNTEAKPEKRTASLPAAAAVASATSSYSASAGATATSSTHVEYEKYFEQLIEEANAKNALFQGTDFKEFIDSKVDVEAITDEATRYKTAFNVLKRTGLTKDRLITTGREYLKIIEGDLKGFENAYTQQYKNDVEQKEQLLQKKAEELHELNEKIAALNNDIRQMSQQIVQSKEKLNTNKDLFILAGQNKKKEIQAELQKIEQYF